jgi:hypothetical protein
MSDLEREQLLDRIAELESQLGEAQAVIKQLKAEIEKLMRKGKRQAVPFERRKKVKQQKKTW